MVALPKDVIGTKPAMLKYLVSQSMLCHVNILVVTSRNLQKIAWLDSLWVQHSIQAPQPALTPVLAWPNQ
jgi:hypothetical protein